jgi:hypothetical protein
VTDLMHGAPRTGVEVHGLRIADAAERLHRGEARVAVDDVAQAAATAELGRREPIASPIVASPSGLALIGSPTLRELLGFADGVAV